MKFLEKRWLLIALIILIPFIVLVGLDWGTDINVASKHIVFRYFIIILILTLVPISAFLLETYLLYRLINLSQWGKEKPWKKIICCIGTILLSLATLFSYGYYTNCNLKCDGWQCRPGCDFGTRLVPELM